MNEMVLATPISHLLEQAETLAAQEHWSAAEELYRKALELEPSSLQALEGLGLIVLQNKQLEIALGWLERACSVGHPSAQLHCLLGVAYKRKGDLVRAGHSYEQALAIDSHSFPAAVNLARTLRDMGRRNEAINYFERAVTIRPEAAEAWSMLSNSLRELARFDAALKAVDRALKICPCLLEGHCNRGAVLFQMERFDEATVSFLCAWLLESSSRHMIVNLDHALERAEQDTKSCDNMVVRLARRLRNQCDDVETTRQLAQIEQKRGFLPNAVTCLELCLRRGPSNALLRELAQLLWELGDRHGARMRLGQALELNANDRNALRLLATWAMVERDHVEAERRWRQLLVLEPQDLSVHVNLGAVLVRLPRPMEAARILEGALALDPRSIEAHINLGLALSDQGRFTEARAMYRQGLSLQPHPVLLSNLLFSMHFDPSVTKEELHEQHLRSAELIASNAGSQCPAPGFDRNPERPLRLGLVSPDFRSHPVAYLLEFFLREHDPKNFQIYCYSDVTIPDATTARISSLVHRFHSCWELNQSELTEKITKDQIDILVDLTGHTANNRLSVFARKPCPIQVSWLGYFNTTGLRAIDYRLADAQSIPEGMERYFVERIVRLPRTCNCYVPTHQTPVTRAPSERLSHVTFGCFNNPAKITPGVVSCFAQIMRNTEGSRLILKYGTFADPEMQSRYLEWFAQAGIAKSRLEFHAHSSIASYLDAFANIDIALDPFPYSGETTALHTLWMGVPLVALEGTTLVQRLASRVLRIAGFDEWIAHSSDQYVQIALSLARHPAKLMDRQRIRAQLRASPLMDYRGVAREIEDAFRKMWTEYCRT